MLGIVTDSSAQVPRWVRDRPDVEVVAVHVRVGGTEFLDGVDLDRHWFHEQLADGVDVGTSLPSPGAFASAYRDLERRGATSILSIHVGSAMSGTVNAARLGAELVEVPVEVIDTGLASFGIACCVLEAARLREGGGSSSAIAEQIRQFAPQVRSAFLIQATDFVRSAGRSPVELPSGHDGVAVFGGAGAAIELLGTASSVEDLAAAMVEELVRGDDPLVVAVSEADPSTLPFAAAMTELLAQRDQVIEVIRYEVTPSVLVYSGLGTAGGYSYVCATP